MTVSEFCYAAGETSLDMRLFAWINRAPARARAKAQWLIPRARSQVGRPPPDGKAKYDFTDLDRVFVVGLCDRSGFSAMHPAIPRCAGSSPVASGAYMARAQVGMERRRMRGAWKSPAEVNTAVKAFADSYDLYLDGNGMTPGQVVAQHPEVDEPLVRTPRGAPR